MFQQTIQDLMALADAGGAPVPLLGCLRERIGAFERFECGELLARTEGRPIRFSLSGGLGDVGLKALDELGEQSELRVDTAADLRQRGFASDSGLASLLVVRLRAPGVPVAAIVLGHQRAWSFAAAPLSRIRTLADFTLRLLGREAMPLAAARETVDLTTEVARLRAHIASLEAEISSLRADRPKTGSGKPR